MNQRVELYHPEPLLDIVISRAFANLADMLKLTQHLCKTTGQFIALKGDGVDKELIELPASFHCQTVERLPFVDPNIDRKIVIITN